MCDITHIILTSHSTFELTIFRSTNNLLQAKRSSSFYICIAMANIILLLNQNSRSDYMDWRQSKKKQKILALNSHIQWDWELTEIIQFQMNCTGSLDLCVIHSFCFAWINLNEYWWSGVSVCIPILVSIYITSMDLWLFKEVYGIFSLLLLICFFRAKILVSSIWNSLKMCVRNAIQRHRILC